MHCKVTFALGHLLGEAPQVVVVVDVAAVEDLRGQAQHILVPLLADGGGSEHLMVRQWQPNAVGARGTRCAGPHGIDGAANVGQTQQLCLLLDDSVAMLGEHHLHGHVQPGHRVLNALCRRLESGMHVLIQLHLCLGVLDAVLRQKLAQNVPGIVQWIAGLAHALVHALLEGGGRRARED